MDFASHFSEFQHAFEEMIVSNSYTSSSPTGAAIKSVPMEPPPAFFIPLTRPFEMFCRMIDFVNELSKSVNCRFLYNEHAQQLTFVNSQLEMIGQNPAVANLYKWIKMEQLQSIRVEMSLSTIGADLPSIVAPERELICK